MADHFVRLAEPNDCIYIAERMRKEDVEEVKARSNHEPLTAMTNGYIASIPAFTVVKNHTIPVAMFGSIPDKTLSVSGCIIWMLGTDEIWDIRFQFLRESQMWVSAISRDYDLAYNLIDKRNKLHIRWLRWLGFKFVREIPEYGHQSLPFLEFVRI